MGKYNKLVVALVGAAVEALAVFAGVHLEAATVVAVLVPFLTALGVYQIPNDPPETPPAPPAL